MSLMLVCALAAIAGGCNPTDRPSAKANVQAASLNQQALQPRLERLATAHPELAPQVQDVLTNWGTVPERQTLDQVTPLIEKFKLDNPDEADDVDRVLRRWRARLDNFGQ
jgi:hypothetical protein